MGILYQLTFASGKSYIGVTVCSIEKRILEHAWAAEHGSQFAVHCAWRKYGRPTVTILAFVEPYLLPDAERCAVAAFSTQSPSGYNMTAGGEDNPAKLPEIRAKISAAKLGHEVSAETRAKISAANRGNRHSEDTRRRMAATRRGRPKSVEHRAALSLARSGMEFSATHVANMSKAMTPERIAKLLEAQRAARKKRQG